MREGVRKRHKAEIPTLIKTSARVTGNLTGRVGAGWIGSGSDVM
jgi:hypothetical protein